LPGGRVAGFGVPQTSRKDVATVLLSYISGATIAVTIGN
jgi:hypothetical protein